jgi:hypothetical protein
VCNWYFADSSAVGVAGCSARGDAVWSERYGAGERWMGAEAVGWALHLSAPWLSHCGGVDPGLLPAHPVSCYGVQIRPFNCTMCKTVVIKMFIRPDWCALVVSGYWQDRFIEPKSISHLKLQLFRLSHPLSFETWGNSYQPHQHHPIRLRWGYFSHPSGRQWRDALTWTRLTSPPSNGLTSLAKIVTCYTYYCSCIASLALPATLANLNAKC